MYDFFSPLDEIKKIPSQKAEKNILESYDYLSNDFSSIEKVMRQYNPLELIKLSLWDERKVLREKKKDQRKNASTVLMPVVLQSVLLSSYFTGYGSKRSISEKDWARLKAIIDDVLRRVIRIIENKSALFMADGEKTRREGETYRRVISSYLLPPVVTTESLRKDMTMLSSLFEEKWPSLAINDTDVSTYVINIDNIASKSLKGIDDLCLRVQSYSDEFNLARAQKKDELSGKSEDEIYRIITKENRWEGRAEKLIGERDGFDYYTLDKLTSLSADDFKPFTAGAGSLDIISLLKLGYWPAMRFPFFALDGKLYTFIGKHIPRFIALSSSFSRREASLKDVSAIFFRTGIDTYTYDGNAIDISVLPSYYDTNIFLSPSSLTEIETERCEELSLKACYGHKRLIVDPDGEEDMKNEGDSVLMISSVFMADAARNRNCKHELIKSLLGDLELPEKTSEYNVIDEDEIVNDNPSPVDDDDDMISDEYEYDSSDGDSDVLFDNEVDELPPEYEKKVVDIKKEEEKYALTDEIIAKEEKKSEEEEKYTLDFDDDIFDDSEEEEKLDDIGEKEDDEYYIEEENEEQREEEKVFDDEDSKEDDNGGQLDFFDLLDEDEVDDKPSTEESVKEDDGENDYDAEETEELVPQSPLMPLFDDDKADEEEQEERPLDEEIEKEDEEEFVQEEEKAEELDNEDLDNLPQIDEEKTEEPADVEQSNLSPLDENLLNEEETVSDDDNLDSDDSFTLPSLEDNEEEYVSSTPQKESKNTTADWLSAFMGLDDDVAEEDYSSQEESPFIEEHSLDITNSENDEETEKEASPDSIEDKEDASLENAEVPIEEDIPQNAVENSGEEDRVEPDGDTPLEEEHQILTMEELEGEDEVLPLVSDDKDEYIPYNGIVREIYQTLTSSSVFAGFLDDSGVQTAEELEEVIHNSWEKSKNEGKDKLFNIAQYSISVIISHNLVKDELRKSELYNNAGGIMYSYDRDKWTAILLFIDDSFSLSDAYEKTLTKESFSPSDWKRVTYIGEQIKNKASKNG